MFLDAYGLPREDIPLDELNLSVRSYNCLKNAGFDYASKLVGVTEEALLSIKKLGVKSAGEILSKLETLSFQEVKEQALPAKENVSCKAFVAKIANTLVVSRIKLYQELLPVFERAEEDGRAVDSKDLFAAEYLRRALKHEILDLLSGFTFGAERSEIEALLPENVFAGGVIAEVIDEMAADGMIISTGSKIERRRKTILEYGQSISKENHREFFLKRLRGQTLAAIGGAAGVTRERARQVISQCLRVKPDVAEDKYIELFRKYRFSRKDFSLAFGEDDMTYNYLVIACGKRGELPVGDLLTDEAFPPEIRHKAESVVYKNYITISGERVYKSRSAIVDYLVRSYFQEEASFEDFT
ncbi:MAG: hypothetical protein LBK98_03320, partial [Peptococcaceae bacterium]|nr:hypothetical protein [Peptococcaceae bacterium]